MGVRRPRMYLLLVHFLTLTYCTRLLNIPLAVQAVSMKVANYYSLILLGCLTLMAGCSTQNPDFEKSGDTGSVTDGSVAQKDGSPTVIVDQGIKGDGHTVADQGLVTLDQGPIKQDTVQIKDTNHPKKDTKPKQDKGPPPDVAIPVDADPPLPDFGTDPIAGKVAAIQYGEGQAAYVASGCVQNPAPNLCAVKTLVVQARAGGASLVVIPEYALFGDQQYIEPVPSIGSNPGTNSKWPDDLFIKIFSKQAKTLQIYLVTSVITFSGQDPNYKYHNTQVAFDPTGAVVGVHHKFNLFGNEPQTLTAGNDVMVFDTPLGKVGLLICADIYGSPTLLNKLKYTLGARVVALSSFWTVSNPQNWYKDLAADYDLYVIAANTTISPGHGGGIYAPPNGSALAQEIKTSPRVIFADIPLP